MDKNRFNNFYSSYIFITLIKLIIKNLIKRYTIKN